MDKMRQWSILTAVAVVAVMAAGWFLLVSPQRSHVSSVRSEAVTQTQANSSPQTQVTQLEAQKKGEPAEQRREANIDAKVPDNPALPTLIRQLSAAADSAGVSLTSIAPGAPAAVAATTTAPAPAATTDTTGTATTTATTPTAGAPAASSASLVKIPVTVTVAGSYANVERFFHAVESLTRAMTVDGWSVATAGGTSASTSGTPTGGSGSGSTSTGVNGLTSTLSANIYMAVPASATTQSAPVAAGTAQ